MTKKTGWLEKWEKGRVLSMVEVAYRRVGVKKTPRRKIFDPDTVSHKDDLYYILDKKVKLGHLCLTGPSVFTNKELVEVELRVAEHDARLRLLGKILKVTTFMEMNQPVFRGDVHFSAVSKTDFDRLVALEDRRKRMAAAQPKKAKVTFKRK
ncbi:MAG TPA: hypothetical protein VD713_07405 [Sphingomonadales bacterium]|nr:hypothetical protein [Sphingomonadales bacterium]